MDTSPEYILQCEKAEEIQAYKWSSRFQVYGSFYYCKDSHKAVVGGARRIEDREDLLSEKENAIFLPRQDQLQEMITNEPGTLLKRIWYFYNAQGYYENNPTFFIPHSMESLWLAFVMKKKYEKVWDSQRKQWVNIKKGEANGREGV